MFSILSNTENIISATCIVSSADAFNLITSKILLFGKELHDIEDCVTSTGNFIQLTAELDCTYNRTELDGHFDVCVIVYVPVYKSLDFSKSKVTGSCHRPIFQIMNFGF